MATFVLVKNKKEVKMEFFNSNNQKKKLILSPGEKRKQRLEDLFGINGILPHINSEKNNKTEIINLNSDTKLPDKFTKSLLAQSNKDIILYAHELLNNNDFWQDKNLHTLAKDSLKGFEYSLKLNLDKKQINLQIQCFIRSVIINFFTKVGFKPQEVRFENTPDYVYRWKNLKTTRESLKENRSCYHVATQEGYGTMNMYSVLNSKVRISGKAIDTLQLIRQFPIGIIEDVWIADLRGELDPLLIVQICDRSYALCEWEE